ncbi:MAG: hypothetical protein HRT45_14115 [Bdellovibrionales bacterium]|nr:hypothetical protein [Bdellovibrionales bacterium]
MSARGTDYKIDDNMNLTVLRKYDFVLLPRVLRHDSQAYGFMGNENLRDGLYLLRLALVRDFNGTKMPAAAYINSWEKVVRVNGGKIAVPMHFAIENLTLIGSRNRLIVDLKPIDENKVVYQPGQEAKPLAEKLVDQTRTLRQSQLIRRDTGLVTNVFAGPFIPLYEGQGKSLIESPHLNYEEMINAGKAFEKEQTGLANARSSLQVYDKKLRLKHIDLEQKEHTDWLEYGEPHLTNNAQISTSNLIKALMATEARMQDADVELGYRLCQLWTDKHLPEMLERFRKEDEESQLQRAVISPESYQRFAGFFYSWCVGQVTTSDSVFEVERKLEIGKIDPSSLSYRGGQSFNLVVNSGFRMDKGQGWDVRNNHPGSISGSFGIGADIFISASAKRTETFSSSEGRSYTMGQGAGLSYGMGAYLVVQHSIFQMSVEAKQQCLIVKPKYDMMRYLMESHLVDLDADFKREAERKWWFGFGRTKAEREELQAQRVRDLIPENRLLDLMDTGLRICGKPRSPRRLLQEDYYYVTQHFTTGDMHDPTNLKNRPWLLEIRSKRDFNVFLRSLLLHNELSDVGDIEHGPIDILADAYSHYENHLPTWPGLYTEYPSEIDQSEHCDPTKDVGEMIFGFAKEVALGPFTNYDGYGIDFWEIYHCADR